MKIALHKTALCRGCFSRAAILHVIEEPGDPPLGPPFWHSNVPYSKEEVKQINDQADVIIAAVNGDNT